MDEIMFIVDGEKYIIRGKRVFKVNEFNNEVELVPVEHIPVSHQCMPLDEVPLPCDHIYNDQKHKGQQS